MANQHFQHVRSTGKMLTYDVEITPSRYKIRRNGEVLSDQARPLVAGGNVSDDEATRVFAINDIEHLFGMQEE
jgi:hypothetical protein